MIATDELRRLLDERGIEYKMHGIIGGKAVTWHGSVCNWVALPDENGLAVAVYKDYLTPKQAIAATLGRGTCKNKAPRYLDFLCSKCGFVHYIDDANCTGDGNDWNYCPYCGARVERREE